MKRHSLDAKVLDFTWKQNRLSKDKELLKNSMLDVLNKKAKFGDKKMENSVMLETEQSKLQVNLITLLTD